MELRRIVERVKEQHQEVVSHAVQEPASEAVDVGEQTGDGEEVGEGDEEDPPQEKDMSDWKTIIERAMARQRNQDPIRRDTVAVQRARRSYDKVQRARGRWLEANYGYLEGKLPKAEMERIDRDRYALEPTLPYHLRGLQETENMNLRPKPGDIEKLEAANPDLKDPSKPILRQGELPSRAVERMAGKVYPNIRAPEPGDNVDVWTMVPKGRTTSDYIMGKAIVDKAWEKERGRYLQAGKPPYLKPNAKTAYEALKEYVAKNAKTTGVKASTKKKETGKRKAK